MRILLRRHDRCRPRPLPATTAAGHAAPHRDHSQRHPRPRHPNDAVRGRLIPPCPSAHPAPPLPDLKAQSQAADGRAVAHVGAREPRIER